MITKTNRLAVMLAATVMAGGAALVAAPAASATASATTAAVICPFEVKRETPRWRGPNTPRYNGTWKAGNIISVYQGSAEGGRVKTTSGYWATASQLTSAGQCRS
ncbi:hypothetical protein E1267_07475 [Nonomuraea longispora]|uniref:SH3 domain-containing protein n=1 Tax=Nonomuraea longispora TaxID=1848320 RepID=A0A4R4NK39_9ACTN|nr:hypothetical protein [Nonomuraea longispora]TDC09485.1 hypothetical protein E1267_07475 [Nonomuraea longispora]